MSKAKKAKKRSSNHVASPFSTGGGGVTFEQRVGASYLISLLARDVAHGAPSAGITSEVRFQQRWSGCVLDDVVVTARAGNGESRLALQVRFDLPFSDRDGNFCAVIKACWETFTGMRGWPFDPQQDRLGIALGILPTSLQRHVIPLLELVRGSRDAQELEQKLRTKGFASSQKDEYLKVFRSAFGKAAEREITGDELWNVLRCLNVVHFDVMSEGSRDIVWCRNRLLDILQERDPGQASALFSLLCELVGQEARRAGGFTAGRLRNQIPPSFRLRGQAGYEGDLEKLRSHTNRVLGNIETTLGGYVELPRGDLVGSVLNALKRAQVVVLTGEPGNGKSALAKLASRVLSAENVVVIGAAAERLDFPTFESFTADLQLRSSFQTVLGAAPLAPLRCVFIDGLEKAVDERRLRTLKDLFGEVQEFNEKVIKGEGHQDNCWKIIATCRKEALHVVESCVTPRRLYSESGLRSDQGLRAHQDRVEFFEVSGFTDDEMANVYGKFPGLRHLKSLPHLGDLLRRPFILDLLTSPRLAVQSDQMPEIVSESWLMELFWKKVVRLNEETHTGRGLPDAREQVLLQAVQRSLKTNSPLLDPSGFDLEAIGGLVMDGILQREDGRIRFRHDVLLDWAIAKLLTFRADRLPEVIRGVRESFALVRPLRLAVLRWLESDRAADRWNETLEFLDKQADLSPRWSHTALTAPFYSPLLDRILPLIEPFLFKGKAELFSKLLRALRTVGTIPDPTFLPELQAVIGESLEAVTAYTSVPQVHLWQPVMELVLKHRNELALNDDVRKCLKLYLQKTPRGTPLREELGLFVIERLQPLLSGDIYDPKDVIPELFGTALWSADCLPKEVEALVRQALQLRRTRDIEEVLLSIEGYQPLCEYLPELLARVIGQTLCYAPGPVSEDYPGSWHLRDLGIHDSQVNWQPPSYLKGPFFLLLQKAPEIGVQLILRITNHATESWKTRAEARRNEHPVAQVIRLPSGQREIWGDQQVYQWFRYPGVGPAPVTSALMALEAWMLHAIRQGGDAKKLFEQLLQQDTSAAVVGVCASVAMAQPQECAEAVLPILECPAFWLMDNVRLVQDVTAPAMIRMLSSISTNDFEMKLLEKEAQAPHRQGSLEQLAARLMLSSLKIRAQLLPLVRAFPDNPPVFYEEQRASPAFMDQQRETCQFMAARVDVEKYQVSQGPEEGTVILESILPPELEAKRQAKLKEMEPYNQAISVQMWAIAYLDQNEKGISLTEEQAFQLTQQLSKLDDPTKPPTNVQAQTVARAIAAAAAALVVRERTWLKEGEKLAWCRQQLLTAARRPQGPEDFASEMTRFAMEYDRSSARALPHLLLEDPQDEVVKNEILKLLFHPHYEVRAYLYDALGVLWEQDPEFVKLCIKLGMELAIESCKKRIRRKLERLKAWSQRVVAHAQKAGSGSFHRKLAYLDGRSVDYFALTCAMQAIRSSQIPKGDDRQWVASQIVDLFKHTLRLHLKARSAGRDGGYLVFHEWDHAFFQTSARFFLAEDADADIEQQVIVPLLANWERAPEVLEEFLRSCQLAGVNDLTLQPQMLELWLRVGESVLSSRIVTMSGRRWLDREVENILGLLIFSDPMITWQVKEWAGLRELVPFISRWCEVVGHRPRCFLRLISLLNSIGFPVMLGHGIKWLHVALSKSPNVNMFLKERDIADSLAGLLHRTWQEYKAALLKDEENLSNFTLMVDNLAALGEPLATRLQTRICAEGKQLEANTR